PGGGPGEFASTEQRGHLELKDPFLQKMVPLYNAEVSRHSLAVEKELRPTMEQIAVLDALIQKTRDQTGFWAGLENFLTDPLALVGLAGSFVSFGAGAGIAAREALKTWSTEKGAEDALRRLQAKRDKLWRYATRRRNDMGVYRPFSVDGLDSDLNRG